MRGGEVVSVTGVPIILQEADDEAPFRVRLKGHKLSLPGALEDLLYRPGTLTAFFTRWSHMLINLASAEDGAGYRRCGPTGSPRYRTSEASPNVSGW